MRSEAAKDEQGNPFGSHQCLELQEVAGISEPRRVYVIEDVLRVRHAHS